MTLFEPTVISNSLPEKQEMSLSFSVNKTLFELSEHINFKVW